MNHTIRKTSTIEAILMFVSIGMICFFLFNGCVAHAQEMNAVAPFASVEKAVAADKHWYDHLDIGSAVLVSTGNASLKTSLLGLDATLDTPALGNNTFVEVVGYYGWQQRGAGGAAGGLRSTGTLTVFVKKIYTAQSISAGMLYSSGSDGVAYHPPLHRLVAYTKSTLAMTTDERQRWHAGIVLATMDVQAFAGLGGDFALNAFFPKQ
jgi:hypothetical protein